MRPAQRFPSQERFSIGSYISLVGDYPTAAARLLIAVTIASGLSLRARQAEAEPVREVTVMTYNIHHGAGTDGSLDLLRIAEIIRREQPDVVALQEVDDRLARSEQVFQAAELAALTEMKYVFGPNLTIEQGQYGNAVLSKWLPITGRNQLLPNQDEGEQRGVICLEFSERDVAGGLTFLATHWDHRRPDGQRLESAEFVNQMIQPRAGRLALLAGDLNATWDSAPLTVLQRTWLRPHNAALLTSPAELPRRQIDYVLLHSGTTWQPVEARVLDEPLASDHRPLVAKFQLPLSN